MNTHLLALQLMAVQGLLGAFDTIYHHELTEALPQRPSARRELSIHAVRALIYSALFIGLSAWHWHGAWALVLLVLFTIEIILTLWDFVVEDRTRLLPATERVTHTVLAMNGGAFIMLLALNMPSWWSLPSAFAWQPQGWLSAWLGVCGIGVGLSGVRDALAAMRLGRTRVQHLSPLHFSDRSENVLVTGATGFIGQRLVRALVADGQQVIVLSRHPRQAAWLFDGRVRCIGSMDELPSHTPIDVIVNLAGARILGWRWTAARKAICRQSRIDLTQRIIQWIAQAKHKPRLLLSASAIGYYGIQAAGDDTALPETAEPQPIFMSELCRDWEAVARSAVRYGVPVVCMRLGVVFGQQGALKMMALPIRMGLGGALGSGQQWLSWIHVLDVLRGIAFLMRLQAHDPAQLRDTYNFTAPQPVRQKHFAEVAAKVLRRPCFFPTPAWPMRLLLGEQADLLLEGQRVVPANLQAQGFAFSYPQLHQALGDLLAAHFESLDIQANRAEESVLSEGRLQ